jgi:hypothetical protein
MNETCDLFEIDSLNPLLRKLPPERTLIEWSDILKFRPRLKSSPAKRIPESHAHVIKSIFVPTTLLVQVVVSLFTMLIVSLRQRDPRLAENRRMLFAFAEAKRAKMAADLRNLPWFPEGASGAILMGPTGCMKTHTLRALFRLLPQVIEHGPEPECGWMALKQLVYLHVDIDASRGGLMLAIATAADRALGTDYARAVQRLKTVEQKMVEVLHILMVHRCGMLVLDEVQTRNVAPKVLGPEFVAFFLRTMNCGIPLVLAGNPLSFEHVLNHSQDLRRLVDTGKFEFYPFYDGLDREWTKQMVPGVWTWSVFEKPDEFLPGPELLYSRTGGVADFLARYRRETLVQALRAGVDCVRKKHFEAAFDSPAMRGLRPLISAYVARDVSKLGDFSDQPMAYLDEFWNRMKAKRGAEAKRAPGTERATDDKKSSKTKVKAHQSDVPALP